MFFWHETCIFFFFTHKMYRYSYWRRGFRIFWLFGLKNLFICVVVVQTNGVSKSRERGDSRSVSAVFSAAHRILRTKPKNGPRMNEADYGKNHPLTDRESRQSRFCPFRTTSQTKYDYVIVSTHILTLTPTPPNFSQSKKPNKWTPLFHSPFKLIKSAPFFSLSL